MSSIRDAYEQAIGFYNAGDVEGLVSLYTEDATLVTPFGTFEGRPAIRGAWSRDKAAIPACGPVTACNRPGSESCRRGILRCA